MALQFFLKSSRAARHSFFRDLITRRFDLRTMTFNSNVRNMLFCERPPKGFEKFFRDKPSKKEVPREEPKSSKEPPKQSKSSNPAPPPRSKSSSSGSSEGPKIDFSAHFS